MMKSFAVFRRDSGFKQQLSAAATMGVFLFALLSSLLTSWQGSRQIRHTLLEQGEHIAKNLASQSALALLYASAENAREVVDTTLSFPDVTRVEIRLSNGRPLIVRGSSAVDIVDAPMPDTSVRQAYLEGESADSWRFVAPVLSKGEDSPFEVTERKVELLGFVRVVQSKETLSRMLTQIFLINLAVSFLFASLFLFVVHRLANRMTLPITELSEVMARAEHGELAVRANVGGPRDIRDMAQAFNSMIVALQEREQALRESQASYREVVDSVKEVIFQTDAEGAWTLLNPAWREITGIDVGAALGRPMVDLLHEEDRPLAALWQSRLARGEVPSCRFEARFSHAGGSVGWLEVAQHGRWDECGGFAGTSGTLFDITERRLAAERLEHQNIELENRVRQRTAELEISNRELEAFSYSVSHDLRAPLRAIDGFAHILEEEYGGRLDDNGRHHLSRVRAGSQRMSQLIDDLLQLARLSRATLNRQSTDLGVIARDIVRELAEAEPQRQVDIRIDGDLSACADPVLMRVALDNLLRNAWKFTARRNPAQIVFGTATVTTPTGSEPAFFVRDNGAGFDMAYADKLFRPFSRLHSDKQFAGTGVGLANVQRVIHRHGGRLWAEGQVDHGATFYFTLPTPAA